MAVAGQVVDYVTRQDVGQNKVDVVGSSFGDTLSDNESGYSTHYSPDSIDLHVQ